MTASTYLYIMLVLVGIITITQIIIMIQKGIKLSLYREIHTIQKNLMSLQLKLLKESTKNKKE